jgi:hypothetical protein
VNDLRRWTELAEAEVRARRLGRGGQPQVPSSELRYEMGLRYCRQRCCPDIIVLLARLKVLDLKVGDEKSDQFGIIARSNDTVSASS